MEPVAWPETQLERSSSSGLGSQKTLQTVAAAWLCVIRERTRPHTYLSSIGLSIMDLFLMLCLMLFEKLRRDRLVERQRAHGCIITRKI